MFMSHPFFNHSIFRDPFDDPFFTNPFGDPFFQGIVCGGPEVSSGGILLDHTIHWPKSTLKYNTLENTLTKFDR